MIFGYSGAGKSTFAKLIQKKYKLPILNIDNILFTDNWKKRKSTEINNDLNIFLQNDSWIIEGNGTNNLFYERALKADLIIFMNLSRFICYKQAKKRYKEYKNKEREDRPKNCNENFNLSFRLWILFTSRFYKNKSKYKKIIKDFKTKTINIKTIKEVNNLINFINNKNLEEFINHDKNVI